MYLLLLGGINLSRRPFLTTGARDMAALGVAISGFVFSGPMELFLPEQAAEHFGAWVWLLLLAFYGLAVTLVVLLMRPRLVIYNASPEQLRPILAGVVGELDADARWAGDSLVLPRLGVQLHVEPFGALRSAQLVAAGPLQNYAGWHQLEAALAAALKKAKSAPNAYGVSLVVVGLAMVALVTLRLVSDPTTVVQSLDEMLRR